ncbi:BgTH12-03591 [Blumeria graminis f. sp. triticale]|uniref:BgTH12-03591 n=1 Tax=Blumeria graminis f. sp. triticale TaxID=1689686 RepID=A0A9W4GBH2_BLUGR|nr:BgTH12-03591 [Blumeria graminis f. sp. triticale]
MSTHCHDEHSKHGHNHSDHGHTEDLTPALQYSLYQHINFDKVTCLNEAETHSGRTIMKKTWAERLEPEPQLQSDADEQLLLFIPFTAQIRLHAIVVRTSPSSAAPRTLKLWANATDIDFATALERPPSQTIVLAQTDEVQEVAVQRARFATLHCLSLFIEDNYGNDITAFSYLAFKGDWMPIGRAPQNITYEAAANPRDHSIKGTTINQMGSSLGGRH